MMASFALIPAYRAKKIFLDHNKIGDHGADKLAVALPHLTSLQDAWLNSVSKHL